MIATRVLISLARFPLLRRLIRRRIDRYPENSVVTIAHGRGAGLLWRRHHRYVNGYWIGHYELPLQDALQRELRPGHTFFDVGAHGGFFTLLASRLVGNGGRCLAFEPSPENCAGIREQVELNPPCRCLIVNEAISDFVGTAAFSSAWAGSPVGHLGTPAAEEREMSVEVTTIDRACARFGSPNLIKLDIEGAEAKALAGAWNTLTTLRPVWLIELHGAECERAVKILLRQARYVFFDLRGLALDPAEPLPAHFIARPAEVPGA